MTEDKKPNYIILFALLVIFFTAWHQHDGAEAVSACGIQAGSEKVEVVAGWEIAPVQPEEPERMPGQARGPTAGVTADMDRLVPNLEQIREEMYWDSMELLAICVEAEAGNQGMEGKRLVADVILNRADDGSGEWPDTIEGVITQYPQFASYWDGGMDRVAEPSEETFEAVRMELKERSYPGIYYFREGGWPEYGTPWRKVGDHYFNKR